MAGRTPLPDSEEIHLHWTVVPANESDIRPLLPLLSDDERRRADRFKVEHPRLCHVATHAFLRTQVGRYTGRDAAAIDFRHGPHGKPYLADGDEILQFNLSHSGNHIVLAVTAGTEVGVDVEVLRAMPRAERLARRFFSDVEASQVASLEGAARLRGFFHLWTAKEAYLKATGTGLTVPLREVEVSPHTDDPIHLVRIGDDRAEAARWSLVRPQSPEGTVCTVAIIGQGWRWRTKSTVDS